MLKSECTPEQWEARLASMRARRDNDPEAVRAYHREYSARPEAKAKRQARNRTEEKKAAERERYRARKEAGKIKGAVRTEEEKAARKEAYRNCPERKAREKARRDELDRMKPERIEKRRQYLQDYSRRKNANFTPEQYKAALEAQGGGCAICGSTYRLHADHDHETGMPRGILCATCNQVEGMLNKIGIDPVDYGRLLKVYLSRPPLKY